ncbi:MAG: hypothetical protein AAF236_16265, partial [Verrucomicrobiota bacterium]
FNDLAVIFNDRFQASLSSIGDGFETIFGAITSLFDGASGSAAGVGVSLNTGLIDALATIATIGSSLQDSIRLASIAGAQFLGSALLEAFGDVAVAGPSLIVTALERAFEGFSNSGIGQLLNLDGFESRGFAQIQQDLSSTIADLLGADFLVDAANDSLSDASGSLSDAFSQTGAALGSAADAATAFANQAVNDALSDISDIGQGNGVFQFDTTGAEQELEGFLSGLRQRVDQAADATAFTADLQGDLDFENSIQVSLAELDASAEAAFAAAEAAITDSGESFASAVTNLGEEPLATFGDQLAETAAAAGTFETVATDTTSAITELGREAEAARGRIRLLSSDEESRIGQNQNNRTDFSQDNFRGIDGATFSGLDELEALNDSARTFGEAVNASGRIFGEAAEQFSQIPPPSTNPTDLTPPDTSDPADTTANGLLSQQLNCLRSMKAHLKSIDKSSQQALEVLTTRLPEKTI